MRPYHPRRGAVVMLAGALVLAGRGSALPASPDTPRAPALARADTTAALRPAATSPRGTTRGWRAARGASTSPRPSHRSQVQLLARVTTGGPPAGMNRAHTVPVELLTAASRSGSARL